MSGVGVLVLAAGLSRRMAPHNKLLVRDAVGRTMVGRVVAAALASRAAGVFVVTGHQAEMVESAVRAMGPVTCIRADGYAQGLAASLAAGIAGLPADITAALICLGDMPRVTPSLLDRLIEAAAGEGIVVPTCAGRRGNPVLWNRRFFPDMLRLRGDEGARGLMRVHAQSITEVETNDHAVLTDYDTAEALEEGKEAVLF